MSRHERARPLRSAHTGARSVEGSPVCALGRSEALIPERAARKGSPVGRLEQVYRLERDAGVLCRILGLYAARGIDLLRADYARDEKDIMTLTVCVADEHT